MNVSREQRRSLMAVQRAMVKRMMALPKRPAEHFEADWKQREQFAEAHIRTASTSHWGDAQFYRCMIPFAVMLRCLPRAASPAEPCGGAIADVGVGAKDGLHRKRLGSEAAEGG